MAFEFACRGVDGAREVANCLDALFLLILDTTAQLLAKSRCEFCRLLLCQPDSSSSHLRDIAGLGGARLVAEGRLLIAHTLARPELLGGGAALLAGKAMLLPAGTRLFSA